MRIIHFFHSPTVLLLSLCLLMAHPALAAISISSIEELQKIGNDPAYPLDGDYILSQDIDASETEFWNEGAGFDPIGDYHYYDPSVSFNGSFDGRGHHITGLYINRSSKFYGGLFASTESRSEISNLAIEDCVVLCLDKVGGLIGNNAGTVSNCHITGVVSGNNSVGGLIGESCAGQVSRCSSKAVVSGSRSVGGLIGKQTDGIVSECYATGAVSSSSSAGGLIGYNYGVIMNSYATGTVSSPQQAGGLISANFGTVFHCYAGGYTYCSRGRGSVAYSNSGEITASFYDKEITRMQRDDSETGLMTAQMKQKSSFEAAGWNFNESGIWNIAEGDGYPFLQWAHTPEERFSLLTDSPGGTVEVTPNLDAYAPNAPLTLTAVPAAGYIFAGWIGEGLDHIGAPQLNPLILMMHADIELKALFLPDAPIEISSIEELQRIGQEASFPLHWDYLLTQDIDASATEDWNSGAGFEPIGRFAYQASFFSGSFDGQGHTITGLHINHPSHNNIGLFDTIAENGQVANLGLIAGVFSGNSYVGSLAGDNSGLVSNCYTAVEVSGNYGVGGLLGLSDGVVSRSYATATVLGSWSVGGLVGHNTGSISQCYARGSLTGLSQEIGGLVGDNSSGDISQCFATTMVYGHEVVGGLVGYANNGSVQNSYAAGYVSGYRDAGGLIGKASDAHVIASFWDIHSSSQTDSAGGSGLETDEMLQSATFAEAGWNFSGLGGEGPIWNIIEGISYPFFQESSSPSESFRLRCTSLHGSIQASPYRPAYAPNEPVFLTATPDPRYVFAGWIGDGLGNGGLLNLNPLPLVLYEDRELSAIFLPAGPLEIETLEDLQKIGKEPSFPLHWDYVLSQDIDASSSRDWNNSAGFEPIGEKLFPFTGHFDGQNHSIVGLHINRPDQDYLGLFSCVGKDGEISNFNLSDVRISGASYIGALVGLNMGLVSNNHVSGVISGGGYMGGLIGYNDAGSVSNNNADATISGGIALGGLIGKNYYGALDYNVALGDVTIVYPSDGFGSGGLVGWNESGVISSSYASGDVFGCSSVGGLIGANNLAEISNSYATGKVSGWYRALGGLIGTNTGAITNSYATGAVSLISTSSKAGSTCKRNYPSQLHDLQSSFFSATIEISVTKEKDSFIGGIIGSNSSNMYEGSTTACFWDIQTSGLSHSDGGTGLDTAELTQAATFEQAGWDFTNVWGIDEGQSYPFLQALSESAEGEGEVAGIHSADYQAPFFQIDLSELLRFIQFYNAGAYHCATVDEASDEGFEAGLGDSSCIKHDGDYQEPAWEISQSEVLRLVQFYNSGGYHPCDAGASDEGYCPGPAGE